ncbi:cytochrome P450 [Rhizobium sp. BK251]|uniref:cytochrome P450 n=1 Tax=Rhizobium sp. BK251 TaxID=2512125 RepID=UPI001050CD2B|nr:cytochrome P450 [Rhizobium sp. BK251]TCL70502.1 cytochrome P450 [Rhizobium sp. BK251]
MRDAQLFIVDHETPSSPIDPYADEILADPWDAYEKLQDMGPAVWLEKYGMFALTRYDSVVRALKDATAFSSASGVMMNDPMNAILRGNTLCSDGSDHQRLRRITAKPLAPTVLNALKSEIYATAVNVADRLVEKKTFCAATELATVLPVEIVANAVGLPLQGRERMLVWAEQMYNCFGPLNDRARDAFPVLGEMMHYAATQAVRGKLKPGSWADGIIDAVERGEADQDVLPALMIDYLGPSLETTISAIGSGIWLFARNPEEWRKVRDDPSCIPSAVNEILRMETPLQGYSRLAARDYDMDGVTLPAGARAIIFFGAANRDKRRFPDPHRFDVMRNPMDQVAFGTGPHACIGLHLAKLEMVALFFALATRVKQFHIEEEVRNINNTLRGFKRLIVTVDADDS